MPFETGIFLSDIEKWDTHTCELI